MLSAALPALHHRLLVQLWKPVWSLHYITEGIVVSLLPSSSESLVMYFEPCLLFCEDVSIGPIRIESNGTWALDVRHLR